MGASAFQIKDCTLNVLATGRRAYTLHELMEHIAVVEPDCIYNHFWGRLLHSRFEEPEYDNDFAAWVGHAVRDPTLAERLSVLDPTGSEGTEDLREQLLETIAERLDESESLPWARSPWPFHFLHSQIVVFDTRRRIREPAELAAELPHLSPGSVFYHFIDARRRLPQGEDDFSAWLADFGEEQAALRAALADVDPFFSTLPELQEDLVAVVTAHAGART